MDENQEFTPTSTREQITNNMLVPESPEVIKKPPRLSIATKVSEIRTYAKTHLININLLLKDNALESPQEPVESMDACILLEELAKSESLSPSEHFQRIQHALKASSKLKDQIKTDIGKLESSIIQIDDRRQIDWKLIKFEKASFFKKITALFERRRLINQKTIIQQEIDNLSAQIQAKRDQFDHLQKQEEPFRQKREELMIDEITQGVQLVKEKYEQLFQEILEDGKISEEIRDSYIKRVIAPKVEEAMKKRGLPEGKRDEFYQTLKDYLDHKNRPQEELQPYKERFDHLLEEGFWETNNDCQNLINGKDEHMVKQLVAMLAVEDIAPLKDIAETHYYDEWGLRERFSRAFEKAIEASDIWYRDRDSFGNQILLALRESEDEHYTDMDFWQAVKDSPCANQIFGKFMMKQDEKLYQTALDKSLSDTGGRYIDQLSYYPSPDAIRILFTLASADYNNYRTVHANWSLNTLAKRPDWKNILDEAEKTYPSLKGQRSVLQSWDYSEYSNNPAIRNMVDEFALDICRDKEIDQRLVSLAVESLTNDSIMTILAEKGILSEQEAITLKEADAFLKHISEEYRKKDDDSIPYIKEYPFRNELRKNLFAVIAQGAGTIKEQQLSIIRRFESLSRAVLKNKTNYQVLDFLTEDFVINQINDPSFKTEMLATFLEAYKNCPALLTDKNFLREFCRQFKDEQSLIFFRDMSIAYQNKEQLNQIIPLVREEALTKERALELPIKAPAVLSSPQLSIAIEFPQLFLETDDGLDFFNQINSVGLFSLDKDLDVRIGEKVRTLQKERKLSISNLMEKIIPHEIEQIDTLLNSDVSTEVNQQNWHQLLMGYVRSQVEVWGLPKLSQASTDKINALFKDPMVCNMCLNGLRNSWLDYLGSGKLENFPFSLNIISEFINYCEDAGHLSQVESLNLLIGRVNKTFSKETTVKRTKFEICQGMLAMEERFTREKWSNEERTDFYNISRDILGAAPSLFSDYLALFKKFSPAQMKLFTKDIYPLYRTKLVLMEKKDYRTFDKKELVHFREDIRFFADVFNSSEKPFENQKQKLLGEIRSFFIDRFGIIKIPQELSSDHIRSIINISTYLANLHERSADKETVLGFYLSMMINDRWDGFRRGEIIDPSEYLTPEKNSVVNKLIQERQRLNPLTAERLGISEEEMPEFFKLLQQETQNMVVGDIETIDVKLGNIILNLRGLEDLDLYPDPLDKQRMRLLLGWGHKRIGSVVAKMYQSLATPGKAIQFSEEDTKIQQQVAQVMQQLDLNLTPKTLKEYFQDGIKPLATVVNLLNFIEDKRAESEIELLRDLLKPSEHVIQIFKRLGEDFKPTSGAMALSQDLSYLDNLSVKREDELTQEEKALLTEYTANIREQMIKLEEIYSQIKIKFGNFKQGGAGQNPLLQKKLDQIERIVNTQITQQAITSTATNNLNTIIENIRECLSCTREGCNNDTNLTFGDMNKFYLYSQSETQQKGSISDQIAFVEPISRENGSQSMAFVLDRIYGTNTPTILENQVDAVLKKYRTIKQRFPNIRLFIFVSEAAIKTGGTSMEMIQERLKNKNVHIKKESVEVEVAESATGDHYIEFGGSPRAAGKRQTNGIVII